MPLYYFALKCGSDVIADREGIELPDHGAAHAEAVAIARELMFCRELPTRKWRLQVCDDDLNPCSEVLFAEADETLGHLAPHYRETVEALARHSASLDDAFGEVRASLVEVRETLARADKIIATTFKMGHERTRTGERR
jgi:hypothetical protein